jgi:transglutaminase-like putative cysteine protease
MLLTVVHTTSYRYAEPVTRSTQCVRLTPQAGPRQRIVAWDLRMPAPAVSLRDPFDNLTHMLTLDRPHQEITLVAAGSVEVEDQDQGEPAGRIDPMVFLRTTPLTEPDDALDAFVEPIRAQARTRPLIGVSDLAAAVLDRMPYEKGYTTAQSTAAQSFAAGRGVCQDHSHVFIACCRLLGVPARYVSGYVYSEDREQVDSHAWAEAWLGSRWGSFDVSNAAAAGGAHIKLAVGLDYSDACPVRGVRLGGGEESLRTFARIRSA